MRVHTALHLLTVVLPFPVIGGQVAAGAIRLGKIENKGAGSRRVTIMVEARTG